MRFLSLASVSSLELLFLNNLIFSSSRWPLLFAVTHSCTLIDGMVSGNLFNFALSPYCGVILSALGMLIGKLLVMVTFGGAIGLFTLGCSGLDGLSGDDGCRYPLGCLLERCLVRLL